MKRPSLAIRRLGLRVALLLASPCASLGAQGAGTGRIEGVVYDSLSRRPLAGATVTVLQAAPASQQLLSATSDGQGRYRVDSLAPGRYVVDFTTPFLDSLEVQYPSREVVLAADERARLDFATPSRGTLVRGACPAAAPDRGRGAIIGSVTDADTDAPLAGATVAVSWTEIGLDLKAMRGVTQERDASVVTDALGRYRVCGLPTDAYVLLQVQREGMAGAALRTSIAEAAGVMVRNLSLSAAAARTFAAADARVAADTATRRLTGTAAVSGRVTTAEGSPVSGAQLGVVDAASTTRSEADGRFTLAGLPAGTQVLEARQIGFLLAQQPVELRAGRTGHSDVRLSRIVTLDSVRVVAQRSRLREFERRSGKGTAAALVMDEAQLEKLNVSEIGDAFRHGRVLGFELVGEGLAARVKSTRGLASLDANCYANVVVDGMQHQDINLVPKPSIAAIEVYRGAAGAPAEYDAPCGVIIIWTKR